MRKQSKVQKRKGSLGAPQIPTSVKGIARMMSDRKLGIDVKVRKYRLKSYRDCFVGELDPACSPLLGLG